MEVRAAGRIIERTCWRWSTYALWDSSVELPSGKVPLTTMRSWPLAPSSMILSGAVGSTKRHRHEKMPLFPSSEQGSNSRRHPANSPKDARASVTA